MHGIEWFLFSTISSNFQNVSAELSFVVKRFAILKEWKPIKHQISNYRQRHRKNTIAYTSTKSDQSFNPKLHASLSILFFHSWNYLMIQLRYIESISLSGTWFLFFPPIFFLLYFFPFHGMWFVSRIQRKRKGEREKERFKSKFVTTDARKILNC